MPDTHWISPRFNIVRAAHAEYIVADLERSRSFYVDLLGFVVSEETEDALYLRGYEERLHHSLVLRRGPVPAVGHLAFRVGSSEDLAMLADYFASLECPVSWVTNVEAGQSARLTSAGSARLHDGIFLCYATCRTAIAAFRHL